MKGKPIIQDPLLIETVEQALEPLKKLLPPDLLEHCREEAMMLMSSHPYPVALLRSLRDHGQIQTTTEVTMPHAAAEPEGGETPDASVVQLNGKKREGGAA